MKVIGQDERAYKNCTCEKCGAIVQYLPKDVQRRDGLDYSGGPDGATWIVCPQCSETIILSRW